jgi:hypothetical protein
MIDDRRRDINCIIPNIAITIFSILRIWALVIRSTLDFFLAQEPHSNSTMK